MKNWSYFSHKTYRWWLLLDINFNI